MSLFDLQEKSAKSKKRVRHEVDDEKVELQTTSKRKCIENKSAVYKSIFGEEKATADELKFHGDFMTRCAKMGLR